MGSYAQTLAKQPDGTQGIATVEFKSGSSSEQVKILVGCAIHVSKKDKGHRTILKVEDEENSQVKYFIFVPWFKSSRPEINESTSIEIELHRYKKKENKKTFSVNENNSKEIFKKYDSDEYLVIPCPVERNYQKSSFLKKWSSELRLYNNSSQVSSSTSNSKCPGCSSPSQGQGHSFQNQEARDDRFHGFKKEEENFKYHGFHQEPALEEQGVLLIMSNCKVSKCERYVIGCYKKENDNTEKYCFLLRGLEKFPPPHDQRPEPVSTDDAVDSPPTVQPPLGILESSGTPSSLQPSVSTVAPADNPPPRQPSVSTVAPADNPPPQQLPVSTVAPADNPPPRQPSVSTEGLSGTLPSQQEPPVSTDDAVDSPTTVQPPLSIPESSGTPSPQQPSVSTEGLSGTLPSQHKPTKCAPEQERETFTHFLLTFAEKVSTDWKFLGRRLGIPGYDIEAIDADFNKTKEKALQMFTKWQEIDGKEATPEKLKMALEEDPLNNRALAEMVEEWINTGRSAR